TPAEEKLKVKGMTDEAVKVKRDEAATASLPGDDIVFVRPAVLVGRRRCNTLGESILAQGPRDDASPKERCVARILRIRVADLVVVIRVDANQIWFSPRVEILAGRYGSGADAGPGIVRFLHVWR